MPVSRVGLSAAVVRIIRNFSWLAAGQAVFRLVQFALIALLARILSVQDYAHITLVMIYASLWMPGFNFGLGVIGVREMAKDNVDPQEFLRLVLPVKLGLSVTALLGMGVGGELLGYGGDSRAVLLLMSGAVVVLSLAEFFHLPFTAREDMDVTALLVMAERSVVAGCAAVALLAGLGEYGFAAGYFGGSVIGLGGAAVICVRRFGRLGLSWRPDHQLWYIRESAPVALNMLFATLYGRAGAVVLERFQSQQDVAAFNTALFLLLAMQTVIGILMHALLPPISAAEKRSAERLRDQLTVGLKFGLPFLIAVSPAAVWLVARVAPLVFGDSLVNLAPVVALLMWVVPLYTANTVIGTFLRANDRQGVVARATGIGLAVNVGVSVPLAMSAGGVGVAFAGVVTELLVLGMLWYAMAGPSRKREMRGVARLMCGVIISVLLIACAELLGWPPVVVPILAVAPMVLMLASGGINRAEMAGMWTTLSERHDGRGDYGIDE